MNLLLIEDDAVFAEALSAELRTFGHSVTAVGDGRSALQAFDSERYDAAVLDWMLPQLDGVSVLQRMRRDGTTIPVIMLSARGQSADKIEGLEAGADDYVTKPVAGEELHARLNALVRGRGWQAGESETLRAGDIVVSPAKFRAWRDGKPLDLAVLELNLLAELVRNADAVVTRAMLWERVWHYDFAPSANVIQAHICRLRNHLTAHGGDDPIVTMRGVGYMLRA